MWSNIMQGSRKNREIDMHIQEHDKMAAKLTLKALFAEQPKNKNAKKAFKKAIEVVK